MTKLWILIKKYKWEVSEKVSKSQFSEGVKRLGNIKLGLAIPFFIKAKYYHKLKTQKGLLLVKTR